MGHPEYPDPVHLSNMGMNSPFLTTIGWLFCGRFWHFIWRLIICMFWRNFCPKIFLSTDLVDRSSTRAVSRLVI